MAIAHNPSDIPSSAGGPVLFTGIGTFKVLAVNPTLEELHELGILLQKEPVYQVTFDNRTFNKVVFWLGNEDVKVPLEFLVSPGPWMSKTGKYKWYNLQGDNTWAGMEADGTIRMSDLNKSPDGRYYFQNAGTAYLMPRGVDGVTDFVRAWANVLEDGACVLDTLHEISNGDVKELRDLLNVLANNTVRALVTVEAGKYNRVYNRYFGRIKPVRNDLFTRFVNKEGNAPSGEWSVEWKKYVPAPALPTSIADIPAEEDFALPTDMGLEPLPDFPM